MASDTCISLSGNWEEIATAEHPVTFVEFAIIARFGGVVTKEDSWAWTFGHWEEAQDCFGRLPAEKYTYSGIRIELKEKPLPPRVWVVQLSQAQKPSVVHSRTFREYPTPEKLDEPVDENCMFHLVLWEQVEKLYLIKVYLIIQEQMRKDPKARDYFVPFVLEPELVLPGYPRLLCTVSTQEIR